MPRKSRRRSTPRTKTQTRKRSRSTMRRRSRVKRSSRSRSRVKSRSRSRQARSTTINLRGGINTSLAKKVAGVTAATGAVGAASYYYVGQNRKQKELTIKKFLDSFPGVLSTLSSESWNELEELLLAQVSFEEQLESILKTMSTPESKQLQKYTLDDVTSEIIVNVMKEDLFKFDLSTVLPLIERALQKKKLIDIKLQQSRLNSVQTVTNLFKVLQIDLQNLTPFLQKGVSYFGFKDLETNFINNIRDFLQFKIEEQEQEGEQTLQTYLTGLKLTSLNVLLDLQKSLKSTNIITGMIRVINEPSVTNYVTLENWQSYKTQILAKIDEVLKSKLPTSSTSSPLNTPSNPSNPTSSGWLGGVGTYLGF